MGAVNRVIAEPAAGLQRLSIVINNYNYAHFLSAAIDSALAQSWPNVEVIVVDDGSSDDSRSVIEEYGERVRALFKPNGGQASAMNAGAQLATGSIVLFLDADDCLRPQACKRIATRWRGDVAIVQFGLELIDREGRFLGLYPGVGEMEQGLLWRRVLSQGVHRFRHMPTSGLAFDRQALLAVMPIPEQDWRICADGWLIHVVPSQGTVLRLEEILGSYRLHGDNHWFRGSDTQPTWLGAVERQALLLHLAITDFIFRQCPEERSVLPELHRRMLTMRPLGWSADSGRLQGRVIRQALWQCLRAPLPINHRLLYLLMLLVLNVGGQRAHSVVLRLLRPESRPFWLAWMIEVLKGAGFGEQRRQTLAPTTALPLKLDQPVHCVAAGDSLGAGWSQPESDWIWTEEDVAILCIALPAATMPVDLVIDIAHVWRQQRLEVSFGSLLLGRWSIDSPGLVSIPLPSSSTQMSDQVSLTLHLPWAGSGQDIRDPRRLGIAVSTVTLTPRVSQHACAHRRLMEMGTWLDCAGEADGILDILCPRTAQSLACLIRSDELPTGSLVTVWIDGCPVQDVLTDLATCLPTTLLRTGAPVTLTLRAQGHSVKTWSLLPTAWREIMPPLLLTDDFPIHCALYDILRRRKDLHQLFATLDNRKTRAALWGWSLLHGVKEEPAIRQILGAAAWQFFDGIQPTGKITRRELAVQQFTWCLNRIEQPEE